ncbi:unnamed protein product [marine sediment metagenome]|uniref:Uncharacterized protein n=1 Tax=marine sediment metagenome TaxID=412755 RepID=X1N169_9ZZZZ
MVIMVQSLFFAEFLYCNSTIQIESYGTFICIEKELTKCIAWLLEVTFIVSIGVPDSSGPVFEIEDNETGIVMYTEGSCFGLDLIADEIKVSSLMVVLSVGGIGALSR